MVSISSPPHAASRRAGPWCTSHASPVIFCVADTEVSPGRQPMAGFELRSSVRGNSMEVAVTRSITSPAYHGNIKRE